MRRNDDWQALGTGVACILTLALAWLTGCGETDAAQSREVVVFVALDREYSAPILQAFEKQTGITVRPVYDAEAAKTTGLVNRLIAREKDPECDVWWSNEAAQTAALAERGLLAPYESANASRIPPEFRDPESRWTGFAARFRVLIYNTQILKPDEVPQQLEAFTEPAWRGRFAIATPYFGTTFTHALVLRQRWGDGVLEAWLRGLRANEAVFAPGNGPVRDLVAAGEVAIGLTDTDDAYGAMLDGKPVAVALPDPQDGVILIPNTVALVAGAPHATEGQALIDYLLSPEVESALAEARSAQLPLGTDLREHPTPWSELTRGVPLAPLDLDDADTRREAMVDLLRRAEVQP